VNLSVNETHDPELRSWVSSANLPDSDFPIQNLPFAIFRRAATAEPLRGGVAIGDQILDLRAAQAGGSLADCDPEILRACAEPTLNHFMSLGQACGSHLRKCLSSALREGSDAAAILQAHLVPQSAAEFGVPANIGDFTDFYASLHHATRVGRQFRPDSPLLPNYQWIPIAYHGRSSSIQVSEHAFRRPWGQRMPRDAVAPDLGPTRRMDFELEVGIFVGAGNDQGTAIAIENAESHVFGLCLLNDWSARDIQGWEYQPLGPFLAKNFASTISPWIVTMEALAPFRLPFSRAPEDPQPLAYLDHPENRRAGGLDMTLEVALQTSRMRERQLAPERLALSNFRHAYWTIAQMVAHHTVNGCNLRPGDLLGSGTMSGPAPTQACSLLELTAAGKRPLTLPSAETRTFLEDGDRVVLRAWCERRGYRRIGFGTAAGRVMTARSPTDP
jgi:fumarylacetoacetase